LISALYHRQPVAREIDGADMAARFSPVSMAIIGGIV
jgi:hypothetical protein